MSNSYFPRTALTQPPQNGAGKRILVTGANAGIGFWTSLQLAQRGAEVIMACRNMEKAERAAATIRSLLPHATIKTLNLDVSSLESVAIAVDKLQGLERLDVLVANAGVVHAPSKRKESVDGLELVAATNYFGHFALSAGLLPVLERTPGSRVLTLGSLATLLVKPRINDLQLRENYSSWRAYAQSKIMTQSFAFELDKRLKRSGSGVRSLCAHPGYSISGRTPFVAGINEPNSVKRVIDGIQAPFTQGKNHGAWPVVRAALDPHTMDENGPIFFGPRALVKGSAVKQRPARITTDSGTARAIWSEAEQATKMSLL
ncbi:SDR family NAD(P)-dependent oxidoreductase [Arthrobacter sp. MYb227]|uniref:SDR family NAD(P)-dependent oxidoreductase n=1 Tax=Arthrobacter sp. MYb227 TaxID=1848601 RepID=UPI0015E2AA29|nr:SDR family NAD(P)-dependent oxidoreductase [Arthrobacter sp. MYb227]